MTLRRVAEYANAWSTFGPPANFAAKSAILDEWCAKVGRDPAEIERTVAIEGRDIDALDGYLRAGATHVVVRTGRPFALSPVEQLLAHRG